MVVIAESLLFPPFIANYRRGLFPWGLNPGGAIVIPPPNPEIANSPVFPLFIGTYRRGLFPWGLNPRSIDPLNPFFLSAEPRAQGWAIKQGNTLIIAPQQTAIKF